MKRKDMVLLAIVEFLLCCKVRVYSLFDFDNMRREQIVFLGTEDVNSTWGQYVELETNKRLAVPL